MTVSGQKPRPRLGVCYYPEHWPQSQWARDAEKMRALGLSVIRIGEFAWRALEPREGQLSWGWLDEAIETLATAGLEIILGTPSATPPLWVLKKYPDMLAADRDGKPRGFGSRRHYCFSHNGYRAEAARIAGQLAERYGMHRALYAWQIDNEYGCHATTLSYSEAAKQAFARWLGDKYNTIDFLNQRWGNVFWSMGYDTFEDIPLPHQAVTEDNPAHIMDFYRFSSEQVVKFNQAQIEAIRRHSDRPLIHNYMGRITDFDHFDLGADLDIASWDSYPIGFLEDRSDADTDTRHRFLRQGDPDFQAFHHDLYRAVGRGRWGVMEQQPGPVNWAPHNPAPLPGMVRLWAWEAVAHGAEFVNFFRWRQAPFAQEQMHAGLERPDGGDSPTMKEIDRTAGEFALLSGPIQAGKSDIALLFDYPSCWASEITPHGTEFSYFRLIYECYQSLRRLGQNVDIMNAQAPDLCDRKLIIIPGLFCMTDTLKAALDHYDGACLLGPRLASKTEDFQIPGSLNMTDNSGDRRLSRLPPNLPGLDLVITAVESLPQGATLSIPDKGAFKFWREFAETTEPVRYQTEDGQPAVITQGRMTYLCGWPDTALWDHLITDQLSKASKPLEILPVGVRRRDFGAYRLYTNYNASDIIHNGLKIEAADLCLIEKETQTRLL